MPLINIVPNIIYAKFGALNGKSETFGGLGCGADVCYPIENIELYENILNQGGIISEYLLGTKPAPWHFPQRNRLSSGCNRLIKTGAGIVISAKDILEELKYYVFKEESKISAEEKILEKEFLMLYSELGLQPKNIYELIESTGISYEKLVDMLVQLQLKGLVTQPTYNYYARLK